MLNLNSFYRNCKDIFNKTINYFEDSETPLFFKALEDPEFREYKTWSNDWYRNLKTTIRELKLNHASLIQFETALKDNQNTLLSESYFSPFMYGLLLKKCQDRLDEDQELSLYIGNILASASRNLHAALLKQPELASEFLYKDVVRQLIESSLSHSTKRVLELLHYYKGIVPQPFFGKVLNQLKSFVVKQQNNTYISLIKKIELVYQTSIAAVDVDSDNSGFVKKNKPAILSSLFFTYLLLNQRDSILPHSNSIFWQALPHSFNNIGQLICVQGLHYQQTSLYPLITSISIANLLPSAFAQTTSGISNPSFFRTWGKGGHDLSNGQINTENAILYGDTASAGPNKNMLVLEIDSQGNLVFTGTAGGSNDDIIKGGYVDSISGLYIFAGDTTTVNPDLFFGQMNQTSFQGFKVDYGHDYAISILPNVNGSSLLGYTIDYSDAGRVKPIYLNIRPNGTLRSSGIITDNGIHSYVIYGNAVDANLNSFFTGHAFTVNPPFYDYGLLGKFDANGALAWIRRFGVMQGNGIYASGNKSSLVGSTLGTGTELILAQHNTNDGTIVWDRKLSVANNDLKGNAVTVGNNGDIYFTGSINNGVNTQPLVGKASDDGSLGWIYTLPGVEGTGTGISLTNNQTKLRISGSLYGNGNYDVFLTTMDINGNLTYCTFFQTFSPMWSPAAFTSASLPATLRNATVTVTPWNLAVQSFTNPTINTLCEEEVPSITTSDITTSFDVTTGDTSATTDLATTTGSADTTQELTTGSKLATSSATPDVTTGSISSTQFASTTSMFDSFATTLLVLTTAMSVASTTGSFGNNSDEETTDASSNNIILPVVLSLTLLLVIGSMGGILGYLFYRKRYPQNKKRDNIELNDPRNPQFSKSSVHTLPPVVKDQVKIIGDKYILMKKFTRNEAEDLHNQVGIQVNFQPNKNKAEHVLGNGQFGRVRVAKNIKTGKYYCAKKVKGDHKIQLSKQEAEIQKLLTGQKNIMPFVDSVEIPPSEDCPEPRLYQFMELAGFGNGRFFLEQLPYMKSDPMLKRRLIIHIAKGILTGVMSMHNLHISHLDFKPENFVINHLGTTYVIDFGCAQDVSQNNGMVKEGNGDLRYYSPERIANCRKNKNPSKLSEAAKDEIIDTFSAYKEDAWAVGCTLFELYFGFRPFEKQHYTDRIYNWNIKKHEEHLLNLKELYPDNQTQAQSSINDDEFLTVIKGLLQAYPDKRMTIQEALSFSLFKEDPLSEEECKNFLYYLKSLTPPENKPQVIVDNKKLQSDEELNYQKNQDKLVSDNATQPPISMFFQQPNQSLRNSSVEQSSNANSMTIPTNGTNFYAE